ncbi:helix-turn-helix domain-containing protein [Parapedobacter tibetensis]|uniref:helix-turn-helix domain-containing protein n=1 Tax=Parapedobacter tibetensis TaxID=2972951 RepID=UPI00214DE5B4|nr:helix-turn-helix domain-containing protein [Parapedobacter tibetensis]
MAQIFTSYSDREFKEILSEQVKGAVREALHGETAEKQTAPTPNLGYRSRAETRRLLGVAYSTMHYWEKSGILVPDRIGRKVYYSDEAIAGALSRKGGQSK